MKIAPNNIISISFICNSSAKSINFIKAHRNVSCGPRKWDACSTMSMLTGRKKPRYSRKCSSVISYLNGTKFTNGGVIVTTNTVMT